jgi:hypothetical protein
MACAQQSFASFGGRRSISDTGRLHANRAKGGCANVHPLHGPELRALRPLLRRFSPLKCRWQLKQWRAVPLSAMSAEQSGHQEIPRHRDEPPAYSD